METCVSLTKILTESSGRMSARRTARVASVIREVVSTSILQELRDPRIQHVTVLGASQPGPAIRQYSNFGDG